jgi:hypothetical protein
MSKTADLSSLNMAGVVQLHNAINPDGAVAKFKSTAFGAEKVNELIAEKNKGKNKAQFATQVSKLPVATLLLLAAVVPAAKDLTTKLHPAHIRVLDALREQGANEKHVPKEEFHKKFKIKGDDAKLATVLEDLYKANFLIWEENDDLMISEAANNFVEANSELVDKETSWEEIVAAKAKAQRAPREGSARSRTPDTHLITPLITDNPCNPNKRRHQMYAIWLGNTGKDRLTVAQYKEKEGIMFDLLVAQDRGHVALQAPDEKEAKPEAKA